MAAKTEKPTPKRQKDSAKKGQTLKSKDLVTTIVLLSGSIYLFATFDFNAFTDFYVWLLTSGEQLTLRNFINILTLLFFKLTLPFLLVCGVAGAVVSMAQSRFMLATEALKLNFKALNPISGLKRLFSLRTLKELVKSLLFVGVAAGTCYSLIHHYLDPALSVFHGGVAELIAVWRSSAMKTLLVFMAWSASVIVADFMAEYFLYYKDIKMEKQEVKRERKDNEGDPEIKNARRTAHQEFLNGEEMAAIKQSEAVLANPTHLAVGIYFNPEVASLPFITLRCANMKARAAIAYAEEIGVPVVRYKSLTRRLFYTYKKHSFISLTDTALLEVMKVLIWLRQVEVAGLERPDTFPEEEFGNGQTSAKAPQQDYSE